MSVDKNYIAKQRFSAGTNLEFIDKFMLSKCCYNILRSIRLFLVGGVRASSSDVLNVFFSQPHPLPLT